MAKTVKEKVVKKFTFATNTTDKDSYLLRARFD